MNLAGNFFKDIKENTSINTLGSKIKNISQSNWLSETKDILDNAASTIATNLTSDTPSNSNNNNNTHNLNTTQNQNIKINQPNSTLNNMQSNSPISNNNNNNNNNNRVNENSPKHQTSFSHQKVIGHRSPIHHHQHSVVQEDEPVYEKKTSSSHRARLQSEQRKTSFRSRSPDSSPENRQKSIAQSSSNQVDLLQYNALVETNQALKTELQRLSIFELKCKSLEKDLKQFKQLKETNENLEAKLNENELLNKEKLNKLELEIEKLKNLKKNDDELNRQLQTKTNQNLERIESENANLKNKIRDLDRLIEENERNYNQLKIKEQSLEKQNKILENELDRLSEKNTNDEMHSQKLVAIEQANRVLQQELESLKDQQKLERVKLKDKMELLQSKHNERLKKLEDEMRLSEENFNKLRHEDQVLIKSLRKESESMRNRLNEVERVEEKNLLILNELDNLKNENKILLDEKKNLNNVSSDYSHLKDQLKSVSQKYEIEIKNLKVQIDKKEFELIEIGKLRETESQNFLSKLAILNDENLQLANQLKELRLKEDELNKMKKKINDLTNENESLRNELNSYKNLENEIVDVHMKNTNAEQAIADLKFKLEQKENVYRNELTESKNQVQYLDNQLNCLKQQFNDENFKNEKLNSDFSLLKLELTKLESYKIKCEHLEKELNELRMSRMHRQNEYEFSNRKYSESSEKLEYELKILNSHVSNLQNDLRVKEQECKQLEKLLETERNKLSSLIRQMDELNSLNTQLTMQNSDAKRRLVSLDLLTEECNSLRKNLTLMTIESESRKAEVTTLNSQIGIMEHTIKTLRENTEKHTQLETNYESAVYELKKKQDDYKKLQHMHDTVKKEQLDTIEILEEKLRDVEKKTELQALKHEEILLELESIRARRERLLPLCPNCSSQTYAMYQPLNQAQNTQNFQQTSQLQHQQSLQSQSNSPQPNFQQQQQQQQQHAHLIQQQNQLQQQLLSIAIPQQQCISPIISPLQLHNLSHQVQVIALPGKQSVTVECQTSPRTSHDNIAKYDLTIKKQEIIDEYKRSIYVHKINSFTQTNPEPKKQIETKETNTEPIELSVKTSSVSTPKISLIKTTWNQGINCNLYKENQTNSQTQTSSIAPKVYEEKAIQSILENIQTITATNSIEKQQKYILFTCKYNYDPLKNSPNDNPDAELPLTAGDYLFVFSEEDEDGFYNGELLNGKTGLIPSNFVEKVKLDQTNINKYLETQLPKSLLTNTKFLDCLSFYKINIGQVLSNALDKVHLNPALMKTDSTQTVTQIAKPLNKNEKLTLPNPDDSQESSVKIGLPYPYNLKVEKRSETSLLVQWDPPTASLPLNQSIEMDNINTCNSFDLNEQNINIQSYNLYLNHELYCVINGIDERRVVLEDIDLSVPNRISIQAVGAKGAMSKPQECTLLFGLNRSFAPSNLTIHNLTQTSAIVSWWPSSSVFSHVISIDSIEHRALKPGIYRFKLSGLLADTSHLVTITAQIPNHINESSSNYSASVEFRTLQLRTLSIPQNLQIEKDLNEPDTYLLTWNPVVSMPNTISNGIPVGGYSIYLDGIRVHQILNPIASSVSLSSKLLFNGAKLLTVRTLSLDGNSESKDSEPIKLNKNLMIDEKKKPNQTTQNKIMIRNPSQTESISTESSIYSTPIKQPIIITNNDSNKVINPVVTPQFDDKKQINLSQINKPIEANQTNQTNQASNTTLTRRISGVALINQIPKVTDANKKNSKLENKINIESEADLYENNRNNNNNNNNKNSVNSSFMNSNTINTVKKKSSRQNSPNGGIVQTGVSSKSASKQSLKDSQTTQLKTKTNKTEKNYRLFIALFDYDPFKMSPNTDSCQEELPFKEGQLIKIFGDQDSDGFYYGESNGRAGYIPCNMVSEVQVDDQEMMNRLLNDNNNNQNPSNDLSQVDKQKRKSINSKSSPLSNNQTSSKTNKTTKTSSNSSNQKQKEQSFVPINNNNNNNNNNKNLNQNRCVMIALYDYDPQSLSPNVDADVELSFKTGEIITVYGDMDEDGFYIGELNGKRGLVPSNFLQPIEQDNYAIRSPDQNIKK